MNEFEYIQEDHISMIFIYPFILWYFAVIVSGRWSNWLKEKGGRCDLSKRRRELRGVQTVMAWWPSTGTSEQGWQRREQAEGGATAVGQFPPGRDNTCSAARSRANSNGRSGRTGNGRANNWLCAERDSIPLSVFFHICK